MPLLALSDTGAFNQFLLTWEWYTTHVQRSVHVP